MPRLLHRLLSAAALLFASCVYLGGQLKFDERLSSGPAGGVAGLGYMVPLNQSCALHLQYLYVLDEHYLFSYPVGLAWTVGEPWPERPPEGCSEGFRYLASGLSPMNLGYEGSWDWALGGYFGAGYAARTRWTHFGIELRLTVAPPIGRDSLDYNPSRVSLLIYGDPRILFMGF